jgi:hypothetical protein
MFQISQMLKRFALLSSFALASLGSPEAQAQAHLEEQTLAVEEIGSEKWTLESDKDGLEVYSKVRLGNDYKVTKGIVTIDTPPEALIPLLREPESYRSWLSQCKESWMVGNRPNANDFSLFAVIGVPWPFEDRDFVADVRIRRDTNDKDLVVLINSKDAPEVFGKRGHVRVKSLEGRLNLVAMPGGKTRLEMILFLEPSGQLSPVFVNSQAVGIQQKTLKNLKDKGSKMRASGLEWDIPLLDGAEISMTP